MIEYDIVIIGGSPVGRYAASLAIELGAKVALVEPETSPELLNTSALNHIADFKPQSTDWETAVLWAFGVESQIGAFHSLALITAKGVDVIVGSGQFETKPHLAFFVNDRLLVGRTYLLATGSHYLVQDIEGLNKTGFLTLGNISLSLDAAPSNWVILGGTPQSIELAQAASGLNYNVTLIVESSKIISHVDSEVVQLLEAQLEASGVRILKQTKVTQVLSIDDKKWLQAGDKAIETDEIVVAAQTPNIESLNLAAVGVKWHKNRLLVNAKLQTTNNRIYACGDVIGGYALTNLANYEANIALRNALFFPTRKIDYQYVPWGIATRPALAHVGITEAQTQQFYNINEIIVLRQYFKSLPLAQIHDETTGICKLITLKNGEILGASVFGLNAGELINLISFAINHKIKIYHLDKIAPVYPTVGEIILQAAHEWNKMKLDRSNARQELLEDFFQFRRNWNL
ncbi:pyridine nucleotide-disulfide oxidoreductase dimerization region [Calothrix sp. NIES-4071]|nr:pyridine nucleotide-disulfide oxidoreductase dimerization region [Calothrix sp. NIES-4071]BAZ57700.1 pyridine nucleotide-disulfide oxidoreductase dimerization region [Calothrix sp. NIES-4105]